MRTNLRRLLAALALAAACASPAAVADDIAPADSAPDTASGPFYDGTYLSPMVTAVFPVGHHAPLKNGYGGTAAFGWRSGWYAVEIAPIYADLKHAKTFGGAVNGLLFLGSGSNAYVTIGLSDLDYDRFDTPDRKEEFNVVGIDGGLGYILPLHSGRYDWGIRAEARYRYGEREPKYNDADVDIDAPRYFKQVIANVGLFLPLGLRPEPAPVAPPEVAVIASAAVCSDKQDNDGDGKIDFPDDPGCASADDGDETDPPQCSNGKDDDGDGLVDFPADKGCSAADDNDETDPCKTPEPGEKVSLKGCGTGDTIVLRGVNFDFDKATLTANAKTILDNVAEELKAYPDIKVEIGGHTDAKGSDEYNQRLSERRAASVLKYLASKGVSSDRMTSAGYGETRPVADNESDEGRELNRRVELRITN